MSFYSFLCYFQLFLLSCLAIVGSYFIDNYLKSLKESEEQKKNGRK